MNDANNLLLCFLFAGFCFVQCHAKCIQSSQMSFSIIFRDDELATEVAWVVVYLSALSNVATNMLVKSDVVQLLVERLASSNSLQLLIPVRLIIKLK